MCVRWHEAALSDSGVNGNIQIGIARLETGDGLFVLEMTDLALVIKRNAISA